ncbi:MAG: ABC transporter substrate-binding protein [Butyrivibrio sp.]|uniref:ABC transporter substrate-binding protein n=1 Tax=Butyrivibrio sp. TaxID=28121 RepID=UPI0025F7A38C|nr:ABC transporter substrate-binding protein [Butyrivibrio sp.]MCR5771589.1 ABC transporter substrate-binding protein [Butyrivibrio sp.]
MRKQLLRKKIVAVVMAAAMSCGMMACGSSEGKTPNTVASANEEGNIDASVNGTTVSEEASESDEAKEITITDMIGREVKIEPGSYKKVVCIGAGALRMYSYVGDVSILCGVEDIDNESLEERPQMFDGVARPYMLAYGDVFANLPSCGVGGPNAQAAEAEKILTCEPDIVISEYEDVEKEDALSEQLGVPVITLKAGPMGVFDESFAGSMELLGQIFDQEERAEELITYIEDEKNAISEKTKDIKDEDKPSVYICGLGNWGTTNHLMTAQNYVSFNIAGVKNVVTDLENNGIQEIEEEKLVSMGEDIDIMFIDAAAVKNIKPLYAEDNTMFDSIKAWNDGEVYLEMAYNAYYTNYEIALINTWYIASVVYPEAFEDFDVEAKTDEVTQMFLGTPLASDIYEKPASFGGYQKIDTATFFN